MKHFVSFISKKFTHTNILFPRELKNGSIFTQQRAAKNWCAWVVLENGSWSIAM